MKKNITYLFCTIFIAIIFVVFLVLSSILLSLPVYSGTYVYDDKETQIKHNITFFDNTYTINLENYNASASAEDLWSSSRVYYGFYSYAKAGVSPNITEDTIVITSNFNNILDTSTKNEQYKRNSVFSITSNNTGKTYICSSAIALQVFYSIILIGSIVALILLLKKYIHLKKDGK